MYSNAQYYKTMSGNVSGIRVTINGIISCVPLDEANSDFAAIQKLIAEGQLTIAPAEGDK